MIQEIIWMAKALILPPGGLILLCLLIAILSRRVLGKLLLIFTLAAFYLFSTPFMARLLMDGLEILPPLTERQIETSSAQAILVLGGGTHKSAPEYGGDTLSTPALERIRYAARLAKKTGLPVITSGGSPTTGATPEALLARQVLENEFGVKVAATEERSLTTWDNAWLARPVLDKANIRQVLLVTNGWHMLRALDVFERAKIDVIPAPMGFQGNRGIDASYIDWLPSPHALVHTRTALNEYLGRLWYRVK